MLADVPEPDAKARVIVAHGLGIGLADVFLCSDADADAAARTEEMALRCAAGEPVEHVTGKAYFRHCALTVTPDVLIPRHETELVAEHAIGMIRKNGYRSALDLCTGSGCIAIALATETQVQIDACDISEAALKIAQCNAESNGAKIRFFISDMLCDADGRYDIIVSNPPYVSETEYAQLNKSVRLYEPRTALLAGDGLSFYRTIAAQAGDRLIKGGALVLEIGAYQAKSVKALLKDGGLHEISVYKDYSGRDRIVTARKI
jgi:release factor glutamine methyltransferase